MYTIYTDGSFQSSIGSGGYATIIVENDKIIKKIYQGYRNTTNNRMELMGVINALKWLTPKDKAIIYSDSQYVLNNIKYAKGWFENNDLSKKNLDLWFELIDLLVDKDVEFKWVKGHNNNKYNEIADKYCVHAAQCLNIPIDVAYVRKDNI